MAALRPTPSSSYQRPLLINNCATRKWSRHVIICPPPPILPFLVLGTPPPPPPQGTVYQGSLSGSNDANYHPANGFAFNGGTITGDLVGPAGSDFDLRLQSYSCFFFCSWSDVASSTSNSSQESISYNAGSGTYRWKVESYSGSGSYTLTADPQ